MKKLTGVLLSGLMATSMCASAAISASADVTELPADWNPADWSYTVVGDAGLLGDSAWQPENDDFNMSYDEAAGVWYINLNGVANKGDTFYYGAQYKVVVRGWDASNPWEFSFNENGVAYGLDSNSIVDFGEEAEEAEVVTIIFDGYKTTSRIDNPYTVGTPSPVDGDHTYFAVGSGIFDPAWTPNDPKYQMTQGEDGVYSVTIPVSEELWDEPFEYKVAQDGAWTISFNDEGNYEDGAPNALGFVDPDTTEIKITFDPATLKAGFECVKAAEVPTDEPTEEVTDAPTEATTDEPTGEAPSDTTPTEVASSDATEDASSTTNPTSDATGTTSAPTSGSTNATGTAGNNSGSSTSSSTTSSATGKVATGDSAAVAGLLAVVMLAGGAVVVARKRISE